MTAPENTSTATVAQAGTDANQPWWIRSVELVVVILLGVVAIATAHISFQSGLYAGQSDDKVSQSEASGTEAESMYLEGNQQYVQDSQTIQQLQAYSIAAEAGDELAQVQYDNLYFIGVSEELDAAIQSAAVLDESEPEFWHDPQADEEYQEALFGGYHETKAESDALRAQGEELGGHGDRLGFYTALLAVTLFLLGIAAVVKKPLLKWILIGAGSAIFVVTVVLAAQIPFVWL